MLVNISRVKRIDRIGIFKQRIGQVNLRLGQRINDLRRYTKYGRMSIKKANSSLDRNKNRLLLLKIFYHVDNKHPSPVLYYILFHSTY